MSEPILFTRLRQLAGVVRGLGERLDVVEALAPVPGPQGENATWMSGVIGNGVDSDFTITHNLGTRRVAVEVFRNNEDRETVIADVKRPTDNSVQISFANPPAENGFSYVLIGPPA